MGRLIIIGLGPFDGRDISIKGLDELRKCDVVFAEFYTATMAKGTIENLESSINKSITILDRNAVESNNEMLSLASDQDKNVAFLVPGDPLTATTHIEILLHAKEMDVETLVVPCASIVTIVPGLLGLQFYKFGRTTTLAYPEGDYFPQSPYDVISDNKKLGLHTLVLLDIHADENRYMTANEGIELLLKINEQRKDNVFNQSSITCVVARAGSEEPRLAADEARKLVKLDFGPPLHSIVIPGKLHFKESEALIVLANAPKELFN
jgi:diphthine synthase